MPRLPRRQVDAHVTTSATPVAEGAAPLLPIPCGHIGPITLPGSGRLVWWTGRVAIGLRHQALSDFGATSQSGLWIQTLLMRRKPGSPVPV